jgi:hypothetical protein
MISFINNGMSWVLGGWLYDNVRGLHFTHIWYMPCHNYRYLILEKTAVTFTQFESNDHLESGRL